jgi:SdpC family antimicrobial peptide
LVASLVFLAAGPASSSTAADSSQSRKNKKEKRDGEKIFRGLLFGEEGEVSQMFPDIWQRPDVVEQMNTPAKAKAWNALKEKTIARIRKKDPTFFARFGDEIQSGDHLRIQHALAEAGRAITETISTNGAAQVGPAKAGKVIPASTAARGAGRAPQDQTTCDGGICVTQDANGIYVDDDPSWTSDPQDASAMACSAVAVCALAIAVAVWKYAVVVDVAAVAYVAAVVIAIWKWKYRYSYSYSELDSTQTLYQEMLVDEIAEQLAVENYVYE